MGHLGDGALRRMIDEPLASAEADRRHLEGCSPCQERKARIAGDADTASLLLAIPSFEPDTAAALARVHNLAEVAPAPRRAWARWSWKAPRLARPLVLALALVTEWLWSHRLYPDVHRADLGVLFPIHFGSGISSTTISPLRKMAARMVPPGDFLSP